MASQRETVLDAWVAILSAGSPAFTVVKFAVLPVTVDTVPIMVVTPGQESVEPIGHRATDGVSRYCDVFVDCWTKDGTTPTASLDTMTTWAVQKTLADETLGGKCVLIDEISTNWQAEVQDHVYQRATVQFRLRYHTKRTDPTTKVG